MTLTIRTKLTLWYTGLLALSLILSGILFYISIQRAMIMTVDLRLNFLAETMARTIIRPHTAMVLPENFDVIMEKFFGIRTSGNYIQVLDGLGNIKAKSTTLGMFHLPLSERALKNAARNNATYETIDYVGRQPLRVIAYPVMEDGRARYIIQIATSIESIQIALNDVISMFYFISPLVIVFAGIVGLILASKALSPVDEITKLAKKIGAENLNERIKIFGTNDEIDRLAETFNEMIGRLESSFKKVKQFTSDASHELRTPLTILKGETELALKSCNSIQGFREILKSNIEEIDRMSRIVNNLLSLAKMDVKMELRFEDVRLNEVIDEKFRQIRHIAMGRGVEIRVERNDEVIVKGDAIRLRQVVLNLLENAVKYTHKNGSVTLSLERSNDNAIIKVSDTGIGIPKDNIPHIFDRFYRVDKAGGEGGTGLGLSICREIVLSHNGRIDVESEVGKGSIFKVYIPIKK